MQPWLQTRFDRNSTNHFCRVEIFGDDGFHSQVDVRVILGGLDEDTGMGDEDMIGLGSVSGSLTVRDVKASASFGLQQLGVGASIVDYTPDRTRLIVASTGQVCAAFPSMSIMCRAERG